jgi:hypothetical protein
MVRVFTTNAIELPAKTNEYQNHFVVGSVGCLTGGVSGPRRSKGKS